MTAHQPGLRRWLVDLVLLARRAWIRGTWRRLREPRRLAAANRLAFWQGLLLAAGFGRT